MAKKDKEVAGIDYSDIKEAKRIERVELSQKFYKDAENYVVKTFTPKKKK